MALHQFDYVFALGMIFAFLDAWNIGANDVANSWATSIASRSLTYPQAIILAAIMEFLGAVLAGSRVTETIRSKIIDVKQYESAPAGLMLLMACALVGSSVWLTLATRIGAPVSTTHSIVGAVIGAGIAASGADSVNWGWKGFSQIVASWFISPLVAGGFSLIIFLVTKYGVLERKNALRNALFIIPVYFFITVGILTMSIVWKGAKNLKLDKLSNATVIAAIFICGAVAAVVYFIFFFPFFYRRLVLEDWTLKWYEIFYGPLLWRRSKEVPPLPEGRLLVPDYYDKSVASVSLLGANNNVQRRNGSVSDTPATIAVDPNLKDVEAGDISRLPSAASAEEVTGEPSGYRNGKIYDITKDTWRELVLKPRNWPLLVWVLFTRGITQDVLNSQVGNGHDDFLGKGLEEMHGHTKRYSLKVEHLYSFLQCLTACTASWSHGSNDISNACGPLATIYVVWSTNTIGASNDVPIWVMCYTAAALVIGLWTYGYHIMRNLGNKFTLQSPSRGFSIELGAAITTVFAARLGLPVSTTQCLVGSTVFVGLANNTWRAVNWRLVLWCYLGWFLTLPCAGIIAGLLMGIITNAPKLGFQYTM